MRRVVVLTAVLVLVVVSPAAAARPGYAWHDTSTGTAAHFRGLAAVSATTAGGMSWPATGLDRRAAPGAYGFAARGECLTTDQGHRAWFGSGGSEASISRSDDRGVTWTKSPTPLLVGATAGINGIAFNGQNRGIAVGGDFSVPTASPDSFARSFDGGSSWSLVAGASTEYRSGVAWANGHTAIAVGLSGSDVSTDFGATWQRFDDGSLDTVDCARPNACWASGAGGRVAYLVRAR